MIFKKKKAETIVEEIHYYLDGVIYNVIIKKKNNVNSYIRIKKDLNIHVSTNYWETNKNIKKLLDKNIDFIREHVNKQKKEIKNNKKFIIFGNEKNIIISPEFKKVVISGNDIYTPNPKKLENWLKLETKRIFEERLDFIYKRFNENIKYPGLKIRNMTSRWGVCNITKQYITLNSKLIREKPEALDYVIVHELSHLVHANHSKAFWELVSVYCPNYKEIRKELNK